MGSGPIAQACKEMGRRYVGIEIEERYCEIAVQRLAQGVLEFS
jgi:site-specific DNA-methyltransferase (adenine-specific)